MERIDPDLMRRYAAGACTPEERRKVEQWLDQDDNLFDEPAGNPPAPYDQAAAWKELRDTSVRRANRLRGVQHRRWMLGCVAFAMCLVGLYVLPPWQETVKTAGDDLTVYEPAPGRIMQITLPDSTRVWLAGGSRLTHPRRFSATDRQVTLVRGKAFLDVAANPRKPFLLTTDDVRVTVLGTRFQVENFPETAAVQVALESGSIRVSSVTAGSRQLRPDQEITLDRKRGTLTLEDHPGLQHLTGWKDNLLHFRDAALDEVLSELGRHYGVRMDIDSGVNRGIPVTGTFDNLPLSRILSLLGHSTGLHFTLRHKTVNVSAKATIQTMQ